MLHMLQPVDGVTLDKLTYTSPIGDGTIHGNGSTEQTFTANDNIKWRILSKDEITGEVVLISTEAITTDNGTNFELKGAIGYLYAEQELNEICKIYGYGKGADTSKTFHYEIGDIVEGIEQGTITESGARSISLEDINKITKYDPTTAQNDRTPYTHTIFYPTRTTQEGYSSSIKQRTEDNTAYHYEASEYLTNTRSILYQMLFKKEYHVASRGVESSVDYAAFGIGIVEATKQEVGITELFRSTVGKEDVGSGGDISGDGGEEALPDIEDKEDVETEEDLDTGEDISGDGVESGGEEALPDIEDKEDVETDEDASGDGVGNEGEGENSDGEDTEGKAEYTQKIVSTGIRPIIYIKPNIQIGGKDENGAWILIDN